MGKGDKGSSRIGRARDEFSNGVRRARNELNDMTSKARDDIKYSAEEALKEVEVLGQDWIRLTGVMHNDIKKEANEAMDEFKKDASTRFNKFKEDWNANVVGRQKKGNKVEGADRDEELMHSDIIDRFKRALGAKDQSKVIVENMIKEFEDMQNADSTFESNNDSLEEAKRIALEKEGMVADLIRFFESQITAEGGIGGVLRKRGAGVKDAEGTGVDESVGDLIVFEAVKRGIIANYDNIESRYKFIARDVIDSIEVEDTKSAREEFELKEDAPYKELELLVARCVKFVMERGQGLRAYGSLQQESIYKKELQDIIASPNNDNESDVVKKGKGKGIELLSNEGICEDDIELDVDSQASSQDSGFTVEVKEADHDENIAPSSSPNNNNSDKGQESGIAS